jgi:hypothetical protein
MKKNLLFAVTAMILTAVTANAQERATAKDWTLTDIKGKTHTLFTYLDKGYAVYVDASATWCGPCWNYHNTHAMGKAWETNGPTGETGVGSSTKNDLIQIFIEADPKTAKSELSKASRDWTKGTNYPIIDVNATELKTIMAAGIRVPHYPAGTFICPDRTITAKDQATASTLVSMRNACKPFTTGIEKVNAQISSILVYPNPASSVANVEFTLAQGSKVTIEMINAIGQTVSTQFLGSLSIGDQKVTLDINALSKGLYFVNIITDNNKISRKISVEK